MTDPKPAPGPKEAVYDTAIYPLMQQIIALCKANKIAFVAHFSLDKNLQCTSISTGRECRPSSTTVLLGMIAEPNSEAPAALAKAIRAYQLLRSGGGHAHN